MQEKLDEFYLKKGEPVKSCLLTLRDIILNIDPGVAETVKYSMPCFTFNNRAFTYLWTDKQTSEPYILFVEGNKLNFSILETGNRARMKILRVKPNEDLPLKTIKTILSAAIKLNTK